MHNAKRENNTPPAQSPKTRQGAYLTLLFYCVANV